MGPLSRHKSWQQDVLLTNCERDRDHMQVHIFSQSSPRMQFLSSSQKLIKANAMPVGLEFGVGGFGLGGLGGLPLMDEGVGFGCRWCAQLGAVFFNLSIAGGFPRAWTPPL